MVYCNIVIWDPKIVSRVRKTETSRNARMIKQAKLYLAGLRQCYNITNVNLNMLPTYTGANTAQTEALIT